MAKDGNNSKKRGRDAKDEKETKKRTSLVVVLMNLQRSLGTAKISPLLDVAKKMRDEEEPDKEEKHPKKNTAPKKADKERKRTKKNTAPKKAANERKRTKKNTTSLSDSANGQARCGNKGTFKWLEPMRCEEYAGLVELKADRVMQKLLEYTKRREVKDFMADVIPVFEDLKNMKNLPPHYEDHSIDSAVILVYKHFGLRVSDEEGEEDKNLLTARKEYEKGLREAINVYISKTQFEEELQLFGRMA